MIFTSTKLPVIITIGIRVPIRTSSQRSSVAAGKNGTFIGVVAVDADIHLRV